MRSWIVFEGEHENQVILRGDSIVGIHAIPDTEDLVCITIEQGTSFMVRGGVDAIRDRVMSALAASRDSAQPAPQNMITKSRAELRRMNHFDKGATNERC